MVFSIYLIVGFIAGIFSLIYGLSSLNQKRLIENIPTSKIRSIAMGLVEIFGRVIPQERLLKSPFANKECVFYRYTIEEYRRQGKRSHWVTIKQGTDGRYFYLKDETGMVLIDVLGAKIDIPHDNVFQSGLGYDPSAQIQDFLAKNNLGFEGFLSINKKMRYTEYVIEPNDHLYILGTAGDNPFIETASKHTENIMIQKVKHEKIYYISDRRESSVLSSLKWKTFGGLAIGITLILTCLMGILKNLNFF